MGGDIKNLLPFFVKQHYNMARFDYLNDYLNSNMNKFNKGGMLTQYNVGGTHEQNPNGGIPLGEDASVEQGETSVDVNQQGAPQERPTGSKYIFSDRQEWTAADVKAAGLPSMGKDKMTAAEYTTKLFEKSKGREGDLASKETLKTFTQRAQRLAESKRMAEELAVNQAMLANAQANPIAPEEPMPQEYAGMENYTEQPQEQQMFMGGNFSASEAGNLTGGASGIASTMPNAKLNFACGGYMKHRYDGGGYQEFFSNLNKNSGNAPDTVGYNYGNTVGNTTGLGGMSDTAKLGLGSGKAGLTSDPAGPGAGAYIGAATTAYDLYNTAKTGKGAPRDMATGIATGAAKGAMAGMAFGPWGAAIGGVIGGAAGGIASKAAEKDFWKQTNTAITQANSGMPNSQAWSGVASARGGYITSKPAAYAGGGLTGKDRGTGDKAYPMVSSGDFAGGDRSYPIPTRGDAIDALRLAGLHGRSDVRSKVFAKYPDLKKAFGGYTYANGGPDDPNQFNLLKNSTGYPYETQYGMKPLPLISNINAPGQMTMPAGPYTPKLPRTLMNAPLEGQESNIVKNLQDITGVPSTAQGYGTAWGAKSDKAMHEYRMKNDPDYATKTANWLKNNPGGDPVSTYTKDEITSIEYDENKEPFKLGSNWRNWSGLTREGYTPYNQSPTAIPQIDNPAYIAKQEAENAKNADFLRFVGETEGKYAADKATKDIADKKKEEDKNKPGFFDKYGTDIARAAPILSNIQARAAITDPTGTRYARLNDAYNVPQVDEARLLRDVNASYANQTRALGQMGGSQAQQRAALLGAGAQDVQRRGQAYESMANADLNRAAQEQQFKTGIAQYNAAAGDREIETYAKDIGNVETQRSKFTGEIGTQAGDVAKEQAYREMVKNLYGYDDKGNFVNKKTGEKVTAGELALLKEETAKKSTTNMNVVGGQTGTVISAMGGYIKRRKARY